MPPLLLALPAALISGGIAAATGATIFGFTGLTAALIAGGASLALGTVSNLLTGKGSSNNSNASTAVGTIGPSRSPFGVVPDQPRTWCYGRGATGGTIKYWRTSGTDNSDLWFVVAVQDTLADAFEEMYVNNVLIPFSGNAATGTYAGKMYRYDHMGSESQTADSDLVAASGGEWTTDHRLRGMAYYVWHLIYDSKIFASGIPTPVLTIRGRAVWDPRLDNDYGGSGSQHRADPTTWTWSQNSALCTLDYLLGVEMAGVRIGGCGISLDRIDLDSFVAAANICDEDVALHGGGTEKRYTMNGFVDAVEDKNSVVNSMLQTMCGILVYRSGQIALIAGAAQTSTMSLYDDDLAGPLSFNPTTSRQEKCNSITAVYAEPSQLYQVVSAPPLVVPAYEVIDGNLHLEKEVRHRFTTSVATVQRINKLILGNFREQLSLDCIFKPKALLISVGDTFSWTSGTAGYSAQKMVCIERDLQENGSVRIVARQETDAKYAWASSEQQGAPDFSTHTVFDPSVVSAPSSGDVAVSGVNLTGVNSSSVPALLLTCNTPPSPFVLSIITVYKLHSDTNWHSGPTIEPVRPPGPAYITGIAPGASYDVGFAYVTAFGTSAFTVKSSTSSGSNLIATGATAGSITSTMLATGAINSALLFAGNIQPVEVFSSLPSTGNYDGRTVVLTTDGKLYRYHSGAFTAAVQTADLTGTITNAQIAAGAIDLAKVASNLTFVQIGSSLPGTALEGECFYLTTNGKLYRYHSGSWTVATDGADIIASSIIGGSIAAGTITGSLIAGGTITGSLIQALTLDANLIQSSAIQARHMDVDSVTAGSVAAGAINASAIIVNDIVVTGHLTANAVTNASVAVGGSTAIAHFSWTTLATLTKSLSGGDVLVSFNDYITWSTNGPRGHYQILGYGGAQIAYIGYGGGSCPDFINTGGGGLDVSGYTGSVTYYLQAIWEAGANQPTSNAPSLVATELKR